jgi:hypothetical protein
MSEHDLPELPDDFTVPDDLGAFLDAADRSDPTPSQQGAVQVITGIDPQPGAPYICEVRPTDDVAISLPRDKALAYAMAVLVAAEQAEYYAAVVAQWRDIISGSRRPRGRDAEPTGPDDNAVYLARQLATDQPEDDHAATAPLRFEATLNRHTGAAVVRVGLAGQREPLTGWTPAQAREHAGFVLSGAIVADLDTAYRTMMAGTVGAGEQRARAVVDDLGRYRDGGGSGGGESAGVPAPPRVPGPPPGARPAGRRRKRR